MKTKRPQLAGLSRSATGDQPSVRLKPLPAADLISFFRPLEPQMIQWLTRLVNTDTPSDHKQPLDQLASWLAGQFRKCGAQTEIIKNRERGTTCLRVGLARDRAASPFSFWAIWTRCGAWRRASAGRPASSKASYLDRVPLTCAAD
jgi:hypothetical protein